MRLFYSLLALTGVSSAVGIPITVTTNSRVTGKVDSVQLNSGGGEHQLSLTYCNLEGREALQELNYGDEDSKAVCWTVENTVNSTGIQNAQAQYTDLFETVWSQKTNVQAWPNSKKSNWQQQCDGASTPWVILPSRSGGAQYAGLCDSSSAENTKFVKKRKDWVSDNDVGQDKLNFWICSGDCWNVDNYAVSGSTITLQQEKTANWTKVSFKQKA
ncbi:hypothetical protein [Candidatus Mycoplasma haematominutum]|nr:hypothetical protein [Candidatus Mycoplasma haematominutum]